MNGARRGDLPGQHLAQIALLNLPRPPAVTTCVAVLAGM